MRTGLLTLLVLAHALAPTPARAYEINDKISVDGYAQFWLTLYEQMQEAEELYQHPSRDPAATFVSGFSLSRARIGTRIHLLDRLLEMRLQMRLEGNPGILDLYVAVHVHRAFTLQVGQFKIPGAWENLASYRDLDFVTRPTIARNIADFALSRTTYPSSLFYGVHSNFRDMGIGIKGDIDVGPGLLRYFLMLGNGLGANLFIGGGTNKEFIITNAGEFFVGARVEAASFFDVVTLGGHVSLNRHENTVFNSGRTVYDLDRFSYSADLRLTIPKAGVRLTGMYAGGTIDDDYDDDGRTDVTYSGWECRLVWRITETVRSATGGGFTPRHDLEIGARFDRYVYEWNESGAPVTQDDWTFGATYLLLAYLKIQVNYMHRTTRDPSLPDLGDDALILHFQASL